MCSPAIESVYNDILVVKPIYNQVFTAKPVYTYAVSCECLALVMKCDQVNKDSTKQSP